MRDATGRGNIYFDDYFSDSIPFLSLIFWCLNGTIGCINLLATPIVFYFSCIDKSYHRNLRITSSNLYLAFFLLGIGNSVYSIMVLTHFSDKLHEDIFFIFRFLQSLGPGIWKTTFLGIVLERTAATLFCKTYEKKAPIMLGVLLYFLGLTGAILPICYFIVRLHYTVSIMSYGVLNSTCLISIFLLLWSNKRMRRKKFDATIHLSQRYQMTENLRVLRIMAPLILFGTIYDLIASFGFAIQTTIDFNTQLYYPIYVLMTNCYVPLHYMLYLKRDEKVRRKIFGLLCLNYAKVEPEQGQVRNVDGELLVLNDSPDIHFFQLAKFWQ